MGKRVYVIEDDPISLMLLKTLIKNDGFESKTFSDFHQAMKELDTDKSHQELPIAIFSDFMLPQGDGLDFLHQLREKFTSDEIPFYFVTGVQKEIIEPFVEKHDYNEILMKPVERETFHRIMEKLHKEVG